MATKRGNSWEGAVSHKGQRYRRSFPTEHEADLWVLESKASIMRGEPIDMGEKTPRRTDGKPYTLAELVDHVYRTHWAPMSGGESRTVKMTKRVREVITRRREQIEGREVFPELTKWSVQHYWGRLSEALNLEEDRQFVPHILRHEFCSRLAAKKMNAAAIQQLAGHSSMAVTQRYIHLFGGDLDDAIDALEPSKAAPQPDALAVLADVPQELLERLSKAGLLRLPALAS